MQSKLSKSKRIALWKQWVTVERKIKEEMEWLRRVLDTFLEEEKAAPMGCRECFLRRIAILIVSGNVKAAEITKSSSLKSFWIDRKLLTRKRKKIYHGGEWHREMMEKIESHFLCLGYRVVREPNLHHGRADLGIFSKKGKALYVEVGTISFYKLWLNLEAMRNFVYLIVPDDTRLIEFRTLRSPSSIHQQFRSGQNLK